MNRNLFCRTLVFVGLSLVATAVLADQCKEINVRVGAVEYLEPCTYMDIEFFFCIDAPTKGTLNGTWHFYGELGNGIAWPEDGSDPAPYSPLVAGWGLGEFETNKGTIKVQDNWMVNGNVNEPDEFFFVSHMNITGGTGDYEGATGWIGVVADSVGDWRGWARGEVCTP